MTDLTRRRILARAALGGAALITGLGAAPRAARAAEHRVDIKAFAFQPAELEIAAGDSVAFADGDGAPHTATAKDRSFDTGTLSRGQAAALRFDRPGRYDYLCAIHPRMTGRIVVR